VLDRLEIHQTYEKIKEKMLSGMVLRISFFFSFFRSLVVDIVTTKLGKCQQYSIIPIEILSYCNAILHEDVTNLLMSNPVFFLNELVTISQGITISRYRNDEGAEERIVNARNLDQLYIEGDLSLERLRVQNLDQYQLKTSDVVIAIRGTPIKAAVVKDEVEDSLAGQNLAVLRPKVKNINPVYLAVVLCSKWLEQSLATLYGQSSATQLISIAELRKLQIPLPDLTTQDKIAQLFLSAERARKITMEALETRQRLTEFTLFQILEEQQ
jgi:hypothetical protein